MTSIVDNENDERISNKNYILYVTERPKQCFFLPTHHNEYFGVCMRTLLRSIAKVLQNRWEFGVQMVSYPVKVSFCDKHHTVADVETSYGGWELCVPEILVAIL